MDDWGPAHDLDAVDVRQVQGRQVEGAAPGVVRVVDLDAVEQEDGEVGLAAADEDLGHAAGAGLVDVQPGHVPQQVDDDRVVAGLDLVPLDHGASAGQDLLLGRQPGAGDDQLLRSAASGGGISAHAAIPARPADCHNLIISYGSDAGPADCGPGRKRRPRARCSVRRYRPEPGAVRIEGVIDLADRPGIVQGLHGQGRQVGAPDPAHGPGVLGQVGPALGLLVQQAARGE